MDCHSFSMKLHYYMRDSRRQNHSLERFPWQVCNLTRAGVGLRAEDCPLSVYSLLMKKGPKFMLRSNRTKPFLGFSMAHN